MTREQYVLMAEAERACALGRFEAAHEALDQGVRDPELCLEASRRKLNVLLREGRWQEAEHFARFLCQFEPEEPDHLGKLAEALRGRGHPVEALEILDHVPEALQTDALHQYRLGLCHSAAGDVPRAVHHLRAAMRESPELLGSALAEPTLQGLRDFLDPVRAPKRSHPRHHPPTDRGRDRDLAPVLTAVPVRP